MRSRQTNFNTMCRRVLELFEKQIDIFNNLPAHSKLISRFKENLHQIQEIAIEQRKAIRGKRARKNKVKLELARETMTISCKIEAYALITKDIILQRKVHLAETHLLKLSDVNFTSTCSIIYHTAHANLNALVAYDVDEALLMHLKASIDNYQTIMGTPKEAIIIRKQFTHQLAKRIEEQRDILNTLDTLMGTIQYTQPETYALYKDTRSVLYRSRSLTGKCQVTDAASTKPIAGATLTFSQNETPLLKKSSAKGGGTRIKSLPDGTYTLTVSRLGYTAQTLTIHISNTKLTTINVALEKTL